MQENFFVFDKKTDQSEEIFIFLQLFKKERTDLDFYKN
jgi:hypothetical protein